MSQPLSQPSSLELAPEPAALQYPKFFQGVFARRRDDFIPLVEEARRSLHTMAVPEALRPFFDTVVRDNPQPSFILLPLMFLAMAESTGGIQAVHRRALPVLLLAMEVCAITDDTIDRTPMRSGRRTFALRFGEPSTAAFVGGMVALAAREAARVSPSLHEATMSLFADLGALQMWERQHIYPKDGLFGRWLLNRYEESVIGVSFGLDTALRLNGRPALTRDVLEPFGRIFQDVDDLVNIVEERRSDGENDDVLMGAVTRALVVTLEQRPELLMDLANLWRVCRVMTGSSAAAVHKTPAHLNPTIAKLFRPIREALVQIGVPDTARQVMTDYRACFMSAPPEIRPIIQEMTRTWVDRMRHCEGLPAIMAHDARLLEDEPQEAA